MRGAALRPHRTLAAGGARYPLTLPWAQADHSPRSAAPTLLRRRRRRRSPPGPAQPRQKRRLSPPSSRPRRGEMAQGRRHRRRRPLSAGPPLAGRPPREAPSAAPPPTSAPLTGSPVPPQAPFWVFSARFSLKIAAENIGGSGMCPSVTAQGVWRDGVDLVAGWRLLNLTFNFN